MNKKIVIATAVVVLVLLCFALFRDTKRTEQKIEDKVVSSKVAETIANGSNSQYLSKKDRNIKKEKEVSENAFFGAENRNNNSDNIVADFAELCSRAREHNQLRRAGSGSQD